MMLDEVAVVPTLAVGVGSPVVMDSPRTVFIHPLDVLYLTTPDPVEHLQKAMQWLLERAHRKLDALADRLSEPSNTGSKR